MTKGYISQIIGPEIDVAFASDIKEEDGIWTIHKMVMTNVQNGHSSELEIKNVQYNIDLSDNLFTVSSIERGLKK